MIVVLGVFLGLQVNNWNAAGQDRADEEFFMLQLHDDLQNGDALKMRLGNAPFYTLQRICPFYSLWRILIFYTQWRIKGARRSLAMNQSARTAKQIGAIIRRARRNAGLTQIDLGKRIGLRQATISRLEKGEEETKLSTLLAVLSALGLEIIIDKRGRASTWKLEDMF